MNQKEILEIIIVESSSTYSCEYGHRKSRKEKNIKISKFSLVTVTDSGDRKQDWEI